MASIKLMRVAGTSCTWSTSAVFCLCRLPSSFQQNRSGSLLLPQGRSLISNCCLKLELQLDKLLHFSICTLIVPVVHRLSSNCHQYPLANWRLPLAAAASLAVGALKEIGDGLHWWPGAVDLADLVSHVQCA